MTETKKKPVRYMDFISSGRASSSDPFVARPVPRKVVKKPAAHPALRKPAATKTSLKKPYIDISSPSSSTKPARSAQPVRSTATSKSAQKEPKVLYSKKPVLSEAATKEKLAAVSADKSEKTLEFSDKSSSVKVSEKKSSSKNIHESDNPGFDSPDNNQYSLSGKSPFLSNYSIDKRPLSSSVPENKSGEEYEKLSFLGVSDSSDIKSRKKNTYEKKSESSRKKEKGPVTIIESSETTSGLPLALIIILTIVLGAAVGAGLYFILPK